MCFSHNVYSSHFQQAAYLVCGAHVPRDGFTWITCPSPPTSFVESLGTGPCGVLLVSDKGEQRPREDGRAKNYAGTKRNSRKPKAAPKPHQPKISWEARLWGWRQGSTQETRAKRRWNGNCGLKFLGTWILLNEQGLLEVFFLLFMSLSSSCCIPSPLLHSSQVFNCFNEQ